MDIVEIAMLLVWLALTACAPSAPRDRSLGSTPTGSEAAPPNVVMVSIDTLRRDHVGRYDPKGRALTPFLDGLLAAGLTFDDATSCSNWTVPSTACALSGALTLELAPAWGMVPIVSRDTGMVAPIPDTAMVPALLAAEGYDSLLVSTNSLFGPLTGSAQGHTRAVLVSGSATKAWAVTADALDEAALVAPFLLHLHLIEPHSPYLPPRDYVTERLVGLPPCNYDMADPFEQALAKTLLSGLPPDEQAVVRDHLRAAYEAEVRWLDDQLRSLWVELEARGLLDDAVVVLWTDHGEAFWEQAVWTHGQLLYPNENDALLSFSAPGLARQAIDAPVSMIDLTPTLLGLLDLPVPDHVTGVAWPDGDPDPSRIRRSFSEGFLGPVHAVRRDGWLMMFAWLLPQPVSLVDLTTDPEGLVNLYDPADPHPVARELWPLLEADAQAALPWVEDDPRMPLPNWPEELLAP